MCCSRSSRAELRAICDKCGKPVDPGEHVCKQPDVARTQRLADKAPTKPTRTIFLPY